MRRCGQSKVTGPKVEPHQTISRVIENGADRPNEDDEFRDFAHVPWLWSGDLRWTDIVSWDWDLRKIVEQIVGKHLDRRHRHKRKPRAGTYHAEHVSEVRTRAHSNILEDV